VAVGAGALAGGAYAAALDTSIFALQRFALTGASPALSAQVRAALAPELGRSLLRVTGAQVDAVAATLPDVVSLRFTRSFPHTLRIDVVPERPALLLRRGAASFVVSARGRVMGRIAQPADSALPRMWVGKGTLLRVGQTLTAHNGLLGAVAAAGLGPGLIPSGVRFVTVSGTDVTLIMRSGFQIRLGDIGQLQLKLAIAQRIIAYLGSAIADDAYLDVSVPARPVVGSANSQLSTQS
jgi:cell division septal protein FtsQ